MNHEREFEDPSSGKVLRAKFRMALWPLIMYGIGLIWAYLSVPFVGHTSQIQKVVWAVLAAGLFWVIILVFLILTYQDLSSRN
jgi:fatty acid desaturase